MRRTYHVITVTLLLLLALRGSASAEGYRLPVTLTDLVGGAGFATGVELGDSAPGLSLMIGGGVVAALGAPVLHGAEGNTGRMTASIILRGTLPLAGWAIGVRVAQDSYKKFRHGAGLIGFMGGYAIATIVDIAMASTPDAPNQNKRTIGFAFTF